LFEEDVLNTKVTHRPVQ